MANGKVIKLRCPACKKGYRITTTKDGISHCAYCGYSAKREEFEVKEEE